MGALGVGEVLCVELYVQSRVSKSGVAGAYFEPAWFVRTVEHNMDGFQIETTTMKVEKKEIPLEVTFSSAFLGPIKTSCLL